MLTVYLDRPRRGKEPRTTAWVPELRTRFVALDCIGGYEWSERNDLHGTDHGWRYSGRDFMNDDNDGR
jgi:hypothetical protein